MKKLLMLIVMGFSLLMAQNLGDTVRFYRDYYNLILTRDTVPHLGIVVKQDEDFNLISWAEKYPVYSLAYRKAQNYNWVVLGAETNSSDPKLIKISSSALYPNLYPKKWTSTSGLDAISQKITRVNRILSNPSSDPGNFSAIYFATDNGIYASARTNLGSGIIVGLEGKYVYDLAFHMDSIGPIPNQNDTTVKEVIFAATEEGVYKLRCTGKIVSVDTLTARAIRIGYEFEGPILSVYHDTLTGYLYAGRSDGLYYKDLSTNTNWEKDTLIPSFPVYRIKKVQNYLFLCSHKGIYYTLNGGTWENATGISDTLVVLDVEYLNGKYYAAVGKATQTEIEGKGVVEFIPGDPNYIMPVNEGLSLYEKVGGLNVHVLLTEPTVPILLAGTDVGVFAFQGNKWENINYGISDYIADMWLDQIYETIHNPLGQGKNTAQLLREAVNVPKDSLWDLDGNGRINIVLIPYKMLFGLEYVPGISPNVEYSLDKNYIAFDPYDLDPANPFANLGEYFFLNFKKLIHEISGGNDTLKRDVLRSNIACVYGDYLSWSIDHNEHPTIGRAGFGTQLAHLAGFNVLTGIDDEMDFIKDGVSWGGQQQYTYLGPNTPLFFKQGAWRRYPVLGEVQRERIFYFTRYILDQFGDTLFTSMLWDRYNDEISLFRYHLKKFNFNFTDLFINWVFANVIDTNAFSPYHEYKTVTTPFTLDKEGLWTNGIPIFDTRHHSIYSYAFRVYKEEPTDTEFISINLLDNATIFDSIHGEWQKVFVFKIKKINEQVVDIDTLNLDKLLVVKVAGITVDSVNLNQTVDVLLPDTGNVKYYYVFVSTYPVGLPYYIIKNDTTPPDPSVTSLYVLQNPIAEKNLIVYLVSNEKVIPDIYETDYPIVKIVPFDTSLGIQTISLNLVSSEGSYNYYATTLNLDPSYKGDFVLYSRVQDLAGNYLILQDTISIEKIGGGLYSFLGGNVEMDVDEEALYSSFTCVVDRIKPSLFDENAYAVYSIGSSRINFKKPVMIKIKLDENVNLNDKDVCAYLKNGEGWQKLETYINTENREIIFYTQRLGIFKIANGKSTNLPSKISFELEGMNLLKKSQGLSLNIALPTKERIETEIYDVKGARIFRDTRTLNPGYHTLSIPSSKMGAGVYILRVKTKNFNKKFKFIIF